MHRCPTRTRSLLGFDIRAGRVSCVALAASGPLKMAYDLLVEPCTAIRRISHITRETFREKMNRWIIYR